MYFSLSVPPARPTAREAKLKTREICEEGTEFTDKGGLLGIVGVGCGCGCGCGGGRVWIWVGGVESS